MQTQIPSALYLAPQIGFISLGCPKALVDSEKILTQLYLDGYEVVDEYLDAELVIVNTCGFIDVDAVAALNDIAHAIKGDTRTKVIATGRLQSLNTIGIDLHTAVTTVSGTNAYEVLIEKVRECLPKTQKNSAETSQVIDSIPAQGIKLTPAHYAYLNLSEGWNHSCAFCISPDARGSANHRQQNIIIKEAEALAASGVKELLLVSQDTNVFTLNQQNDMGVKDADMANSMILNLANTTNTHIKALCKALSRVEIWTRLNYLYPCSAIDELIPLMTDGRLLPYLDIPFQHTDQGILQAMQRPIHIGGVDKTIQRINDWREIAPDIALKSTFCIGFPGESEAQFQELLDFISEVRFDRLDAFTFMDSMGDNLTSYKGRKLINDEVKVDRIARLLAMQSSITAEKLADKIGSIQPIIIDDLIEDEEIKNVALGRTVYDAPEVDGIVQVEEISGALPGEVVHVEIIDATDNDLIAVPA